MTNTTDWAHLMQRAGRLLYGTEWHSPLARDLDVKLRTIQRWAAGDIKPRPDAAMEIRRELAALIDALPDDDRPHALEAVAIADELLPMLDTESPIYATCLLGLRSLVHDIVVKSRNREARPVVLTRGRTGLRSLVEDLRRWLRVERRHEIADILDLAARRALVLASLCWSPAYSDRHWRETIGADRAPVPTPWLAVSFDYAVAPLTMRPADIPALGNLERVIAWAIIEGAGDT